MIRYDIYMIWYRRKLQWCVLDSCLRLQASVWLLHWVR